MTTNQARITKIEHMDGMTEYTLLCPAGTASDFLIAAEKQLDAKSGFESGDKITFTIFQDECPETPGDFLTLDGQFVEGAVTGEVEAMKISSTSSQQAEMLEIWGEKYGAR